MTVYVDELRVAKGRDLPTIRAGIKHGHRWCHLMADSLEELHLFAAALGMKLSWCHDDHYDLTPPRRAEAVAAGAKEVTSRDLVALRRRNRVPSKS